MIDVIQQINAIDRAIGARTIAAGEARTATIRRSYDADIEDVWDACTNPERLPRWFLPVSGDLRLGGRYQFEGNAVAPSRPVSRRTASPRPGNSPVV